MKPRIGVLTSGGDCPGLNAVLRGVVLAAEKLGWEVIGFRDGFEGLLRPGDHVVLDRNSTEGIMALGGTIIGTTNRGHFVAKVGAGDRTIIPTEVITQAREILNKLGIRSLIIVGGDGSMATALQLQEAGIDCIGVPKTIDNDLEATAMTLGFDSAVAAVVDALDRLHTTATSHKRVMVVEVMGRHAGWIALHGGIAGGADIILIPEIPFDYDKITATIKARDAAGNLGSLVVVAEGAKPKDGQQVMREVKTANFALEASAISWLPRSRNGLARRHALACSAICSVAARFGVKAVQLANEGHFGSMVSYQNYQVRHVPIAEAVNRLRLVPPNGEMVQTARDVEISFGD